MLVGASSLPRGYGMDPDATLSPPRSAAAAQLLRALTGGLRDGWRADAIVHVGKHGTLEWLPGKGVGSRPNASLTASSRTCRFVIRSSSTIPARARRPSAGLTPW